MPDRTVTHNMAPGLGLKVDREDDPSKFICQKCNSAKRDHKYTLSFTKRSYKAVLCKACCIEFIEIVKDYPWWNQLTSEHYQRASNHLKRKDEIMCVIDDWELSGEIIVHTDYTTVAIVEDVSDFFGFKITSCEVVDPNDALHYDCLETHGRCVEIKLDYVTDCPRPLPPELPIEPATKATQWVTERDLLPKDK